MKFLLVFMSVCLLASTTYGTLQMPERLLHEGQELRLACVPLEKYFDANHPKPTEFRCRNTACKRGYIGTWEIKDKQLYLKSLGFFRNRRSLRENHMSLVFKDRESPIKATWYTGVLRCPQGDILRGHRLIPMSLWMEDLYISASYGNIFYIYEKDLYLGVVRGNIVSQYAVDNKKEGATRSIRDWAWVASASGSIKDDFKWYDLRLVTADAFSQNRELGKPFRTRGIYYVDAKRTMPKLSIPPTLATQQLVVALKSIPDDYEGKLWQHVEIKAHFEKESDGYSLHADSIRPLKPGETMHHRNFKPPNKPSEESH